MIPNLDASGNLPPGRHEASLAEIKAKFVDGAPHPGRRALIFRMLELYAELVWDLLPGATLWVDGGFVTHKADEPHDVDVVVVADPVVASAVPIEKLVPLMSLHRVSMEQPRPVGLWKLQPMGDLIDGFFTTSDDSAALAFWDRMWSQVNPKTGSGYKGYLEVVAP